MTYWLPIVQKEYNKLRVTDIEINEEHSLKSQEHDGESFAVNKILTVIHTLNTKKKQSLINK